tara:strand:- start:2915 stop:3742 length:828 start_codon:yes stop_codon:yes gene_type:complete
MTYIISNKYEIIEKIGEGSFGKVFKGKNIRTNESIAIKIQFKTIVNVLQHEAKIYRQLVDVSGVPLLKNYGCENGFHYLIVDLLSKSLDQLDLSHSDVIKYLIASIDILENIHNKSIIHRDIKPDNLLIKYNNNYPELYIIDFGLSKLYQDVNRKHIDFKKDKKIIGTVKYSSINIHNGNESSRRDDIESLCYTFISLYGKTLPWSELCNRLIHEDNKEIEDNIKKIKENSIDWLRDIPGEFATMLLYAQNISFTEKPNYRYLRNLFINLNSLIL